MSLLARTKSFLLSTVLACLAVVLDDAPLFAEDDPAASSKSLSKLTIEELLKIDVTSVTRTEETLREAAAAVTVITNEDLRRSGASTIPEALRNVPGIFVGRRSSNSWAVSSRGFSSVNSEKLLVLSDTRSVYTPLFSGVFWDVQNYLMEDVDRIEVIRGPGASVWGSNAVNGVINITTKDARDTQGLFAIGSSGNEEQLAGIRYGSKLGDDIYYRVFARYFDRGDSFSEEPMRSDDWRMANIGFRSDWEISKEDTVTFQGDGYIGNVGQLAPIVTIIGRPGPDGDLEADVSGGNVLGRWRHKLAPDSEIQFRTYYDRTNRDDPSFDDNLDTIDVDFQHTFGLTPRQQFTWGANYRHTADHNMGFGIFAVEPEVSEDSLVSGFLQNQIVLLDDVRLTVGTKLEHNDFSGFEVQPTARVAWDLTSSQVLWAAFSRAARVPTRIERDVAIDVADPSSDPLPRLLGNRNFDSEKLLAYEIGHRWQAMESLSVDIATFYNDYSGLASLEIGEPFVRPEDGRTIIPVVNENLTEGYSKGVESQIAYAPIPRWRLAFVYSYLDVSLNPHGMDLNRGRFAEGSTPRNQFGLRSYLDLGDGFEFDLQFRDLSSIRTTPESVDGESIDGYAELDARLGWNVNKNLEISIFGQNLLDSHHPEFGIKPARGEIERSVLGRVVYRY